MEEIGRMYDVVVIGAGPASSTAANVLAKQDYKVLLTERCKSCSGILIQKSASIARYFSEQEKAYKEYERNTRELSAYRKRQWCFLANRAWKFREMNREGTHDGNLF